MSAIARVLVAMGHRVTGSDAAESAVLSELSAAGVEALAGHHPALARAAEVVVRSTAVPDGDPEVAAARDAALTVWRRADVLGAICATRRTVAVSGTHGKTTTSAMLAVTLSGLGWHPSFIVGGTICGLGSGAGWDPSGDWLVVEADESDGTFVELGAEAVVVTSVEADHLEFYGGLQGLEAAFGRFVDAAPGPVVVSADDPGAARLAAGRAATTYGTSAAAQVRISEISLGREGSSFVVSPPGGPPVPVRLAVPGEHNVRNAAAALTTAASLGADWAEAAAAVGAFRGVGRRFERRGEAGGVSFVDGYDHLPTEVAAAIATARSGGWARVVVVFQPHRYSRTQTLWRDFSDAFTGADVTVVTGIYPAGEAPRAGVSGRLVFDAVRRAHPDADVRYAETLEEAAILVAGELRPGDVCLTLGAGDVTTLADRLIQMVEGGAVNPPSSSHPSPHPSPGVAPPSPHPPVAAPSPHPPVAPPSPHSSSAAPSPAGRAAEILRSLGTRVVVGGPLGSLTTYRVGGPAALRVTATSLADLRLVAEALDATGLPVLVVGRGSNLLVADAGFPGVAVLLEGEEFTSVSFGGVGVEVGAAVALPALARQSVEAGLTGLEWAVGVPGSVGGGVRMNAGGHGSDVATSLVAATVFDLLSPAGSPRRLRNAELSYGYRTSAVRPTDVVVGAEFRLRPGDPREGRRAIREIVRWRREHQPGGQNAGSVFTNPPGDSAGRLVEAAGFKGFRLGTAAVSDKHANFIQADPGGSADDVLGLLLHVRREVAERLGVLLEPEVRLVGFADREGGNL